MNLKKVTTRRKKTKNSTQTSLRKVMVSGERTCDCEEHSHFHIREISFSFFHLHAISISIFSFEFHIHSIFHFYCFIWFSYPFPFPLFCLSFIFLHLGENILFTIDALICIFFHIHVHVLLCIYPRSSRLHIIIRKDTLDCFKTSLMLIIDSENMVLEALSFRISVIRSSADFCIMAVSYA